jgi:hypothetical protein
VDNDSIAIIVQAAVGLGTMMPILIVVFKAAKKVGVLETKLDNACEDIKSSAKVLSDLPCDEHNTRIAQIEGYIWGRKSVKPDAATRER